MSNEYLDAALSGSAEPNPYLEAAQNLRQSQDVTLRGNLTGAVKVNPDQYATKKRVAGYLGYPVAAVEADPNLEQQATIRQLDNATRDTPALRQKFTDADFAKLAHDDVDNMGMLERTVRSLTGAAKYITSAPDQGNTFMGDIGAGVLRANRGAAGLFQSTIELPAPLLDWMEATNPEEFAGWRGDVGGNPLRRLAEGFAQIGRDNETRAKALSPKSDSTLQSGVSSGVQSFTQNALMLPLAFFPGGQSATLYGMSGMSGGQSYQDAREKGLSSYQALPYAASQAVIEYATEKIPVSKLIGDLNAGTPLMRTIVNQMKSEIPGEQVATILQDLNEWAVLNPDKPFADYLAERPSAAAQTLIATVVGTGGNIALTQTIDRAITSVEQRATRAQQAEQNAQLFANLDQLAAASKVRTRDADTFERFIAQATEDGPVQDVFIDAKTLMQSGMAEQIAAVSPSVAEQLPTALAAGGDVRIPVAEYTARIAGTDLSQSLLDHLKTDENGMSRAEAQTFMESSGQELEAEMARAVAAREDADQFRAQADVVKQEIRSQLDAVGRFDNTVRDAYSTLVGNFFAVMGARLGVSPQELYARYPLRVAAEGVAGSQTLDQGSSRFSEDNRLSNLRIDGPSWERIRESNPQLRNVGLDDEVTVYRATIGDEIRPDDFVAVDKSTLKKELKNVKARDGNAAKIVSMKVRVSDLLMGNDATEFVYFPQSLNQSAFDGPETGNTPIGDATEIEVDGVMRPALNSNGKPIHPTQEGVRNFWRWFGDSKVVDAEGRPLVVYHGSPDMRFMKEDATFKDRWTGSTKAAHWFTTDIRTAKSYADPRRAFDYQNAEEGVISSYIKIEDPFVVEAGGAEWRTAQKRGKTGEAIKEAQSAGNDGVIINNVKDDYNNSKATRPTRTFTVFDSTQIKSATGNRGTFDPANPNILMQSAFHGTPYRGIEKFSTDKIGTGEGAQAYGWGLYFASKREVAEYYRRQLADANMQSADGSLVPIEDSYQWIVKLLDEHDGSYEAARAAMEKHGKSYPWPAEVATRKLNEWETASYSLPSRGQLYEVEIPEDDVMLLWDKPLSEQPAKVREALVAAYDGAWLGDLATQTGEALYKRIDKMGGGDMRAASLELFDLGIKGIKYLDGTSRGAGDGSYNYVIFSGDDVAITNQFYQGDQKARGFFTPDTNVITLLNGADLTTFLHESAHFFLETMVDMSGRPDAPADIAKDMQTVLDWFGIRDLNEWASMDFEERRSHHEKFARGFEAYLFEGRAPSVQMQGIFQRFRAWMVNVYKQLKNLNVELTDEVRGVFDRMLATTEQIQIAEQARSMMPLFESPDQAGMTVEEFAEYHRTGTDATNEAIQDLQARSLRDMQWMRNARGREIVKLQKRAKELRAEVEMEMRREVMSQPIYQAWQALTSKEQPVKLSREALDEMFGGTDQDGKRDRFALLDWKRLTDLRMTSAEGVHPDVLAEQFGFSSGDALVRALVSAERPQDVVDGMTDSAMLERYGELSSPDAIERMADMAIHNDLRARVIATEANALAKAAGQRKILATAARNFADAMIARLKVRDIKPGQYAAAEVRAAKAAEKARGTDLALAAAEKRNQLVNHYAAKSAYAAQDEVDSGVRYLGKFDNEGTRKGLDADYIDQIDALLERFDLRRGQSLKAIDRRAALADWIASQREQGLEPDIPPELVNEAFRKSYRDMTLEEFRGLVDSVKQIEHLGRLKKRLLTAKDQREYEAVRDSIVASIVDNAGDRVVVARTATTQLGNALHQVKKFWASHIKAATWARVMDGGKDGGPMWEYFIRSANERGDMETTMRAEATQKLTEIMAPVFKLGRMGGAGIEFPSLGTDAKGRTRSLNREARIAIALNVGNAGNLQRLLGGEGWTADQIRPVLESLTAAEWQAVQEVWDYFESYRPQIAAKERRVYGKEPDWVEPTPFDITTADGQTVNLRGGYYPIKYDPVASQRAEEHADAEAAKRQLQGAYTSATTRRSFTKSRVEEVSGRPLLYSLAGLYSGVNDVIHDLAWHEWLIDVNRLMRSKTIDGAIRQHYGPEAKDQFKSWIRDVAEGDKAAQNAGEVALSRLRQGVSAAGLGFNVVSAAMQVLGFSQSIVRVGGRWMGKGISQYMGAPRESARMVAEKSEFMANRARTRFRELNELRNRVQDETATMRGIKEGTYYLMMRAQSMVDVPTWLAGYEKAIAEGNDEARAVSLADQAVIDAQGGGQLKDLSAIERGGPAMKLFTVFYSFMNASLNLGVAQTMTAKSKGKLAADYLLLYVVPPVLGAMLKDALIPGGGDDDEDFEALMRKLAAEQLSYLMGLFVVVREFGAAAKIVTGAEGARYGYEGPAGLRFIPDLFKFATQANQGEFDDSFRKSAINVVGDLTGLPAAQINRSITGAQALADDETDNPATLVFGFQR